MDPPPPRTFPLDSPDGPPSLYPSFAPTQWAPPLYPPFGLTQWTPPLYPSFELPHWTPPLYGPFGLTQRTRGRPYLPRFPLLGDLGSPVGFPHENICDSLINGGTDWFPCIVYLQANQCPYIFACHCLYVIRKLGVFLFPDPHVG